jgi:hypothetical protein
VGLARRSLEGIGLGSIWVLGKWHIFLGAKSLLNIARSRHGIVNVYGSDATTSAGSARPKPLKSIGNLTTSIASMKFNHDSQLLAIASNTKKDQMRMVRLPSPFPL